MDLGINGRRALVMGASRGLGKAIAQALIAEAAVVAICARDSRRLEKTADELGAHAFATDLSKPGASAALVSQVISRLGQLDVLVVNTGGPPPSNFADIDDEGWRSGFEALLMSCIGGIRASLPGMRARQWGRIIVVTSVAAREPIANLVLSSGLRAGLHGLVNALSKEVARDGITVNALMPGYTLTERLTDVGTNLGQVAQQIPAGRIGRPEEFAAAAAFISSERAGYITGQAIACDGGLLRSI